jgi:hypothetical protein
MSMERIVKLHADIKRRYDRGDSPLDSLGEATRVALDLLNTYSNPLILFHTGGKPYMAFSTGMRSSRPIHRSLMCGNSPEFIGLWTKLLNSLDAQHHAIDMNEAEIDRALYTAISAFAACFDLWKPLSRKTPGTHFELLMGSLLSRLMPQYQRSKFISLPGQEEKVSTDIVFNAPTRGGLVFPAKITTRERIVQPYAHQRILDSAFPDRRYKSVMLCVSETQLDAANDIANDICVPGTIRLFQAHLAKLEGIYYLDPPTRYQQNDLTSLLRISSYGKLLTTDLMSLARINLQAQNVNHP